MEELKVMYSLCLENLHKVTEIFQTAAFYLRGIRNDELFQLVYRNYSKNSKPLLFLSLRVSSIFI